MRRMLIRQSSLTTISTTNLELLCLGDRFAYLPEKPYAELDIKKMEREICSTERLSDAGENLQATTWIHNAEAENIGEPTVMAFRVNGLSRKRR